MIDHTAPVAAVRIPLDQLRIGENLQRTPEKVTSYAALLLDNPAQDFEPIVVEHDEHGHRIINGHHRFIAYVIAGRPDALCVVIDHRSG